MRKSASAWLVLAGLAVVACRSGTPTLQGAMDGLTEGIADLLGAQSLPGKELQEIYGLHEDDRTWRFRADADDPLERTREAVRRLGTADYGSWREAAVVTMILASMADLHPSALVRAEALDTLTRMAPWTSAAVAAPERPSTEAEADAAVQTIAQAGRQEKDDPGAATALAQALDVVAAFPFDRAESFPEKVDLGALGRSARVKLGTARGVLRGLTGGALGAFDADPRVRDALDRALAATSASAIRLAVVAGASRDPAEIVRSAAVRDLEATRPEQCARILGALLASDGTASVRRESARALGTFPEAEAVPELLPGLSDDRFEVRVSVAAALASATGQSFGDDRRAWTRWWEGRGSSSSGAPAPGGVGTSDAPAGANPR